MFTFRCDPCDLDFDSEPDGTGYDQAPCPLCGRLCVTHEFIEQERRRNGLPNFQFTLRTLLLTITIASIFLSLTVTYRSHFFTIQREVYIYGFPFQAVRVPGYEYAIEVDVVPLIGNVLVFLAVLLGISSGLNWLTSRVVARRTTSHSR